MTRNAGPRARPSNSDADVLRRMRAGLYFGGFNGVTWMVGLGTPMVLMAQQLGADAFQLGLASSFVFLVLPVQVLATGSLSRLGYRRQMILGWGIRALFLLAPLALALLAPAEPRPWMVDLLVASVCGFCLFRAVGVAAHVPWMAAILPVSVRGRYFATEAVVTSMVGVATLLGCASLFASLPGWSAFALVYLVALAGSGLAIASLLRLPDAVAPDAVPLRTLHRETRRLWAEPGPFRFYLALALLGSLASSSLGPFAAYYLKVEAGLPASAILSYIAAQFAGQIVGSASIRLAIDRAPLRRFFRIAAFGVAGVFLFWWAYVSGAASLARWLPVSYFVLGAALGMHNTTHTTYLPELCEERRRPVAMAVFTATHGLLSGAGPMLWGLVLRVAGDVPGIDSDRFALFAAVGCAVQLILIGLYGRVRELRELRST